MRSVRRLLVERRLSVRGLERRGGPAKSHTYDILDGRYGATIDAIARFSRGFGVEPCALIGGAAV